MWSFYPKNNFAYYRNHGRYNRWSIDSSRRHQVRTKLRRQQRRVRMSGWRRWFEKYQAFGKYAIHAQFFWQTRILTTGLVPQEFAKEACKQHLSTTRALPLSLQPQDKIEEVVDICQAKFPSYSRESIRKRIKLCLQNARSRAIAKMKTSKQPEKKVRNGR